MQLGWAAVMLLRHWAASGALHEISQRLPLCSALQEVVPLADELVVVDVLPTLVELVTLVELLDVTELLTFAELPAPT